ncbi:peptidyl-prolyl cis-trans isomerase A (cyclophilin A) [Capnocytophaga haemolytica]|jgi:peptidyl-prolyl cis-trans isomerase cyclophilin type|uniref:peptidylprolyl isomerase n=1 Tax=Capnocytophaga haemolytica TaxID=45243 RepID=A0AAX2H2L6_9FLAO|nr:peptidylprolyl isomerase [Capnocytophaga haemolytica]AMD85696.1 peptidylprolyl isomerase [Capnocytophaga haemolytica]SFN90906.1 peptidyl-prolyl cis-trans isomerase A (cyclophilin A) [Capnocytophaga haemolytica]SNV16361.1 Probable peptidyl-prolyl cis-trans isomerase [Capnocytophaga haemolytica]
MKRMNFLMLLASMLVFFSCNSQKKVYNDLGDGLFADIQTTKGNMIVKLNYKLAPITVANFVSLAEGTNTFVKPEYKGKHYYDGTTFHRVIKDFMIQGGDPTATGMGEPGYRFEDEFSPELRHDKKGIISMANSGPATNGSQFFITHKATPFLDGRHAVFGEVVKGLDVLDAIATTETGPQDKPVQDVKINKIVIVRNGKDAKAFDAPKVFKKYFDDIAKVEKENAAKAEAAATKFLAEVKTQEPQAKALPSGVKIFTLNKGTGAQPNHKQSVLVNYAGHLKNGMLFDSNVKEVEEAYGKYNPMREQGGGYQAFPMPYSSDAQLIPGFKEALLTMKVGDKVRVFIPASQGYGERGAGDVIPPNSDLIFDIEITGIAK